MAYNVKNYTEQGGEKTVIGGTLIYKDVEIKRMAKVAEAAGSNPTAAEFKALLDALKAAGLMATT